MKFGISTSYIEVDFFDELEKIASDFEVVEIALEDTDLTKPSVDRIKSIIKKYDIKTCTHAPITDLNLCSPNDGIRSESIRQIKKSIDIASDLGSNLLNIHFGRLPAFSASFEEIESISKQKREEYFALGIQSLASIAPYALEKNIDLCIENMPNVYTEFCAVYEDIDRVLNEVDVLFTLDVGHAHTIDALHPKRLIDRFKEKLRHVHFHDNHGTWDEHLLLGTGTIQWSDIYKKLQQIHYSGYIILELPHKDALKSRNTFIK